MSHDKAVSRALVGSFRKERDGLGRRKNVVGKWEIEDLGLVRRIDVVRTVSQAGPVQLQARKMEW